MVGPCEHYAARHTWQQVEPYREFLCSTCTPDKVGSGGGVGKYTDPALMRPAEPGADWVINGRRFRETSRTPTPNGFTIEIEALDLPWSDGAAACPTGSTA